MMEGLSIGGSIGRHHSDVLCIGQAKSRLGIASVSLSISQDRVKVRVRDRISQVTARVRLRFGIGQVRVRDTVNTGQVEIRWRSLGAVQACEALITQRYGWTAAAASNGRSYCAGTCER